MISDLIKKYIIRCLIQKLHTSLTCGKQIVDGVTKYQIKVRLLNKDGKEVYTRVFLGSSKQDVMRAFLTRLIPFVESFPMITHKTPMRWNDIPLKKPIFTFPCQSVSIPGHGIVGVDFEGSPPTLAQIAFDNFVIVSSIDSPWIQRVLKSGAYTHAIFGAHEAHLVAKPFDIQGDFSRLYPPKQKPQWGLADLVNLLHVCSCQFRYTKDSKIHKIVDWSDHNNLSQWALKYAAIDAEMTLQIALILKRIERSPTKGV